ncbi:hypothetical protein [Dokdonella sp.]|uniref:hypothetical protein n=1 Tax=Dokdonella sp. TaxID=2291710 RepID=UPI001B111954|nr:hypothetical protein [Dokdonella sp.]MBO9663469.1 hypothetical protein [Dokdonella sp.]
MINREHNPAEWVLFLYELKDAHEHLGSLLNSLSEHADYTEEEFRIDLGHVYAHLNRAWYRRNAKGDILDAEWDTASQFPGDIEPIG